MSEEEKSPPLSTDEAMWAHACRALIYLSSASRLTNIALTTMARGGSVSEEILKDVTQQHDRVSENLDKLISALAAKKWQ